MLTMMKMISSIYINEEDGYNDCGEAVIVARRRRS